MNPTNGPAPTKGQVRVRRLPIIVTTITLFGALVGTLGVSACGSDAKKSNTTTAAADTTLAPEEIHVDAATVKAGLAQLPATIAAAITAIGTPDAKAKLDAIEAGWASFEGTVRDTDATLYLAIEDQLTPLQRQIEDGDSATAATTAASLTALFAQYLAKYP
jgi:hypothetical protein